MLKSTGWECICNLHHLHPQKNVQSRYPIQNAKIFEKKKKKVTIPLISDKVLNSFTCYTEVSIKSHGKMNTEKLSTNTCYDHKMEILGYKRN